MAKNKDGHEAGEELSLAQILAMRGSAPLEPSAPGPDIDAMDGPELTESLEAHGVTDVPHKVDERRALLKSIVLVNI